MSYCIRVLILLLVSLSFSSCKTSGDNLTTQQQLAHAIALKALQNGSFNVEISSIHIYENQRTPVWKQVTDCYFKYHNKEVDLYCSPGIFRHKDLDNSRVQEKGELTFKKKKKNGDYIFALKLIPKHVHNTSEWEITLYKGSNECEFLNREFGRQGLERCNFKGKIYPLNDK